MARVLITFILTRAIMIDNAIIMMNNVKRARSDGILHQERAWANEEAYLDRASRRDTPGRTWSTENVTDFRWRPSRWDIVRDLGRSWCYRLGGVIWIRWLGNTGRHPRIVSLNTLGAYATSSRINDHPLPFAGDRAKATTERFKIRQNARAVNLAKQTTFVLLPPSTMVRFLARFSPIIVHRVIESCAVAQWPTAGLPSTPSPGLCPAPKKEPSLILSVYGHRTAPLIECTQACLECTNLTYGLH